MNTESRITVMGVIQEGLGISLKNVVSLIGAVVLWLLTIWVPYINVGTTIAMCSIPIELSKGHVISPLFIFDAKYRQYMGEFFTLIGLMMLSIIPAMAFMFVPGVIISISWCLAIYIMIDNGVSPTQALVQSNKATYGYKWTIFGVSVVIAVGFLVVAYLFSLLGTVGDILSILLFICIYPINLGCQSVIYKKLYVDRADEIAG